LLWGTEPGHGHGGRVRAWVIAVAVIISIISAVAVIGVVLDVITRIVVIRVIEERVDPHGWHFGVRGASVMVPGVRHPRRVVWCVAVWCVVVRDRCGGVGERRRIGVADHALQFRFWLVVVGMITTCVRGIGVLVRESGGFAVHGFAACPCVLGGNR
jgi:hypothetical protein